MKKNWIRILTIGMVIWLLIISCTLPTGATQVAPESPLSAQDMTTTAMSIALTALAIGTPAATLQAIEPSTQQCSPMVTATTDANIRSGPGTAYDIVGYLPAGGTAIVAGQNDTHIWWFIEFAGGAGGHAWISGSVTTATCIPPALQVVAAPPLPVAVATTEAASSAEAPAEDAPPAAAPQPDLYVSEYSWSPSPPHMGVSFHVRVGAYNQGNAPSGAFTVEWWLSTSAPAPACTWNLPSMAAHGGRILQCDYTPGGWANYPSQVVVDSANTVDESDEGNNTSSQSLQISP